MDTIGLDKEGLANELFDAIEARDVNATKRLLADGVPADVWGLKRDDDGPLQCAACMTGSGSLDMVKALVEAGAELNRQADEECTALHRAVWSEDTDRDGWAIARYLLQAGADPSLPNKQGLNTPEYASCEGRPDAIVALLDAGMDPELTGAAGSLLWYCAWDDLESVRALLSRGADPAKEIQKPHLPNLNGQTPLRRAAEGLESHEDEDLFCAIAIALIEAGADPAEIDPPPRCLELYLHSRAEKAALSEPTSGYTLPGDPQFGRL